MSVRRRDLSLEERLTSQISEISHRIGLLQQERAALERLLVQERRRGLAHSDLARRNSVDRLLAEGEILRVIQEAPVPEVPADYILPRIEIPRLKEATFRSHLHRLKKRGLIASSRRGFWRLASPPADR